MGAMEWLEWMFIRWDVHRVYGREAAWDAEVENVDPLYIYINGYKSGKDYASVKFRTAHNVRTARTQTRTSCSARTVLEFVSNSQLRVRDR